MSTKLPLSPSSPLAPPPSPSNAQCTLNHDGAALFLSIVRKIGAMAIPIMGARILNSLGGFFGTLMVARLGQEVLAASALANSTILTVTMIIWSLQFGVCMLVGRAYGAAKTTEVGGITRQCLWLGLFVGVPSTFLVWFLSSILTLLGQDPELVAMTTPYFHAFAWSVIPSMWAICFVQVAVGISAPRLVVIWGGLTLPCGLFFSYALIFGKYGMPALGLAGGGYASSISFWLAVLLEAIWLGCSKKYAPYRFFKTASWRDWWCFNHLRELLSFGWFTCAQISAEFLAFAASTIFIGWFGTHSLAAQQIVVQISTLLIVIPFAVSQSGGVMISQAVGAKKIYEIRYIGHAALTLGAIIGTMFAVIYCFFPKLIISFYLNPNLSINASTVHIATVLLLVAAFSQFFDILRTIASGALRGLYDTKVPMFVSVFVSCLTSLPIGYVLGNYFHLGAAGIRLGFVISFCMGAGILIRRFHRLSCPVLLAQKLL